MRTLSHFMILGLASCGGTGGGAPSSPPRVEYVASVTFVVAGSPTTYFNAEGRTVLIVNYPFGSQQFHVTGAATVNARPADDGTVELVLTPTADGAVTLAVWQVAG